MPGRFTTTDTTNTKGATAPLYPATFLYRKSELGGLQRISFVVFFVPVVVNII
ncbi:hypothetical protein K2D_40060 [Planctomycetes bacterium K2D]|uniref:Uncharacterized protein n=1 Tax=Botrimarina mediterranea TaxID=2528022 RepID=A0A518KDA7_9BACT|nr:hypothetical protein Spa11_40030 [Botrimarina mediterranea]QDV80378.1 hypothetical protein K2D_40060 [Planctomycetes bacterium K2D]